MKKRNAFLIYDTTLTFRSWKKDPIHSYQISRCMPLPILIHIDISAYDTKINANGYVLVFFITNILFFSRIKAKIANRCNKTVNPTRYNGKNCVSHGSAGISFRF